MKICQKCKRFISDIQDTCIYCRGREHEAVKIKAASISKNYQIYRYEILVDNQAFRIDSTLGKGGFGTVLKVFDLNAKKPYAMKVPLIFDEIFTNNKANNDDDIKQSSKYIQNEVDTILKFMDDTFLYIHKKGIASAYSKGTDNEFPVYLMELAEGTLKDIFNQGLLNTISVEEKEKMIKETVNTISHLHSIDVLHRDLSPDNIFIVDRNGRLNYVLGDFGAAKGLFKARNLSASSKIVGHSAYLDPLRFDDKYRYDFRVDLYSLGIMVTEILMGDLWINIVGEENIAHLMAFDFEKDFLLTEGAKKISREIVGVLRKAVSRNIDNRYQSVSEFRSHLFQALDIDSKKRTPTLDTVPRQETSPPMTKKKGLDFNFSINLPFEPDTKTYAQKIVKIKDEKAITLKDYRGIRIDFTDFAPRKAQILGTDLYNLTVMDHSVILNFKNSLFLKRHQSAGPIAEKIRGDLFFKAKIEIEGV